MYIAAGSSLRVYNTPGWLRRHERIFYNYLHRIKLQIYTAPERQLVSKPVGQRGYKQDGYMTKNAR